MDRIALEFSALEVAGAGNFSIISSGAVTVVTGALYKPGHNYTVTHTSSDGSFQTTVFIWQ